MPFYMYISEDGEEKELFLNMNEMTKEKIINGKLFKLKSDFGGNFILKGGGWYSKNSYIPKKTKADIGIKIDHDKKAEMES